MIILVLNCGSSSIKYKLYDMLHKTVLTEGMVDRIFHKDSFLSFRNKDMDKLELSIVINDYSMGVQAILDTLSSKEYGCIESLTQIEAVGHRVAHGGINIKNSRRLNEKVISKIEACAIFAPIHTPAALAGIRAVQDIMADLPQVAVFDTAFHQSIKPEQYTYGLPHDICKKHKIRKYGFHGTSHKYVAQRACEILDVPFSEQKIITIHLGGGSSINAIKHGKSFDISLGMMTGGGLIMGTRSGDFDPGIITFLMEEENLSIEEMNKMLNNDSGLLGMSGISEDMRELDKAASEGDERAKLSIDVYGYQIKKYIGAYIAAMEGLDMIVFTAGIGENHSYTREYACKNLDFLGISIDTEKNNKTHGTETIISNGKIKVMVVPTDEELMIAMDTERIVANQS